MRLQAGSRRGSEQGLRGSRQVRLVCSVGLLRRVRRQPGLHEAQVRPRASSAQLTYALPCSRVERAVRRRCAQSCGTCDMLDYKKRCPVVNATPAVPPGAMAAMFERAVSNFPEYEPEMLSIDPPVLVLNNFVRDDEIETLLAHADGRFVRSTASGGRKGDEFVPLTSEIRTSWTTWRARGRPLGRARRVGGACAGRGGERGWVRRLRGRWAASLATLIRASHATLHAHAPPSPTPCPTFPSLAAIAHRACGLTGATTRSASRILW